MFSLDISAKHGLQKEPQRCHHIRVYMQWLGELKQTSLGCFSVHAERKRAARFKPFHRMQPAGDGEGAREKSSGIFLLICLGDDLHSGMGITGAGHTRVLALDSG